MFSCSGPWHTRNLARLRRVARDVQAVCVCVCVCVCEGVSTTSRSRAASSDDGLSGQDSGACGRARARVCVCVSSRDDVIGRTQSVLSVLPACSLTHSLTHSPTQSLIAPHMFQRPSLFHSLQTSLSLSSLIHACRQRGDRDGGAQRDCGQQRRHGTRAARHPPVAGRAEEEHRG
jgi:hypothetical protein